MLMSESFGEPIHVDVRERQPHALAACVAGCQGRASGESWPPSIYTVNYGPFIKTQPESQRVSRNWLFGDKASISLKARTPLVQEDAGVSVSGGTPPCPCGNSYRRVCGLSNPGHSRQASRVKEGPTRGDATNPETPTPSRAGGRGGVGIRRQLRQSLGRGGGLHRRRLS